MYRIILVFIFMFMFPIMGMGATSATKDSITWTFNGDYPTGQYVTGDWYVVAPGGLSVTNITPVGAVGRNGTMKNAENKWSHGFDSRASSATYKAELNVALSLPVSLAVNDILISTVSRVSADTANMSYTDEAAILTVVATTPASGSFRPGYCDPNRVTYNTSQIDYSKLLQLPQVSGSLNLETVTDLFRRPWIDFRAGWTGRYIHPMNNMKDYGEDISRDVEMGALMLLEDYTNVEKEELLIGFIQLGIDNYSIVDNGGRKVWLEGAGHSQGRKWPIMFAGLMLNNQPMRQIGDLSGLHLFSGDWPASIPSDYIHFGEDDQTYYVTQGDINITNSDSWNPDTRNPDTAPYDASLLGMADWGIRHADYRQNSDASWKAYYRTCCTGVSYGGWVLAARLMGAKDLWNNPPLFDYMDRYMALSAGEPDPFGYDQPNADVGGGGPSTYVRNMWNTYRGGFGTCEESPVACTGETECTEAGWNYCNGTTCQSAPCVQSAPVFSELYPTSNVPVNTTSVTISATSDVDATTKYSLTPGVDYASMTETMVNTGGKTHSTPISGLTNGSTTPVYLKGLQEDGEPNSTDTIITITVDSEPATCTQAQFWECKTQVDCEGVGLTWYPEGVGHCITIPIPTDWSGPTVVQNGDFELESDGLPLYWINTHGGAVSAQNGVLVVSKEVAGWPPCGVNQVFGGPDRNVQYRYIVNVWGDRGELYTIAQESTFFDNPGTYTGIISTSDDSEDVWLQLPSANNGTTYFDNLIIREIGVSEGTELFIETGTNYN